MSARPSVHLSLCLFPSIPIYEYINTHIHTYIHAPVQHSSGCWTAEAGCKDIISLPVYRSAGLLVLGLPVACRLSPVASAVSATNGMSCPLLCSSLPLWAAAVSGPDPGRASPGLSLSSFVQIRSQRGSHAGGHWQSNTTPLTHPDAIAITGALFVTKPSSLVCPRACLHACGRSIRGRAMASR